MQTTTGMFVTGDSILVIFREFSNDECEEKLLLPCSKNIIQGGKP